MSGHVPIHIYVKVLSNNLVGVTLKLSKNFKVHISGTTKKNVIEEWFNAFFSGSQDPFPIPLALKQLPPFTKRVLENLKKIPFGKTKSYQDIAKDLNNPLAYRAVGTACRRNPFPLIFPCHRVIKQNQTLGNFAYGSSMKQLLLNAESGVLL